VFSAPLSPSTDNSTPLHRGKKEVVHLGDTPYLFAYHASSELHTTWEQPAGTPEDPLAAYRADFLPSTSSVAPLPHPLHRQTGLSHLLVISAFDSEPNFDLSTNKLLLSSVSVALHNAGCTLPAFVPQGPSRTALYTGIMLSGASGGGSFGDLEVKFRSHYDPRGAKIETVADMLTIADSRLDLETESDIAGRFWVTVGPQCRLTWKISAAAKESTTVAASFSFRLAVAPSPSQPSKSSRSLPPLPLRNLAGTTLRYLQLDSYFPSLDPEDQEEPLPSSAPLWLLSRDWRPGPPQLSELLEHLASEWTSAKRREDSGSNRTGGLIRSLMDDQPGSGPSIVETADVHSAALALFSWHAYEGTGSRWTTAVGSPGKIEPSAKQPAASVDQLLPRLVASATVPLDSFLWHLAHRLLDCSSPSTSLSYRHTSVSSFLKALWAEILVALERCWTYGAYIPGVNWAGDNESSMGSDGPTVDLRRALLHQKLAMLNCCIRLRNKRARGDWSEDHGNEKFDDGRRHSTDLVPISDERSSAAPGAWARQDDTDSEPEEHSIVWRSGFGLRERGKKLGEDLGKLFDRQPEEEDEDNDKARWGDLLSKVGKSAKAENSTEVKSAPREGWSGDEAEEEPEDEPEDDDDGSSEVSQAGDVFYETMEDIPKRSSTGRREKDRERPRKRGSIEVEPSSPLSSSNPSESSPNPPLGSSLPSNSYVDVGHHLSKRPMPQQPSSTLMIDDEQDEKERDSLPAEGELLDPEEHAGRSHISLDASGSPMKLVDGSDDCWIPLVQETGHMTEDMVQSLEDRLEKLGSGQEAAKARAEMQTAHLKSDMEAFKAANPRAALEDFVRWHSPRDCVETVDSNGKVVSVKLSSRMQEPGNLWLDLWKVGCWSRSL